MEQPNLREGVHHRDYQHIVAIEDMQRTEPQTEPQTFVVLLAVKSSVVQNDVVKRQRK